MINDITLVLTEACNMRCKYCFEKEGNYRNKYMSEETIEKALMLFLKQQFEHFSISLFGGEPTLNNSALNKLIDILNKTDKSIEIDMTTNLFYINKDIMNRINELAKKTNIDFHICVSVMFNKDLHNEDRIDIKGNGTYDKIIDNLEYCLKNYNNIRFSAHSVISKKNIKNVSKIIDSAIEFKLTHQRLDKNSFALVSTASLNNSEDEYTKEELKYYYEDYIKRDKEQYGLCKKYIEELYFPITYSFDLLHNRELSVCRAMKSEITIGADGNISPCHRADMGYKNVLIPKISYGNIMDMNSIEDVEKNIPKIENIEDGKVKFISELTEGDCTKCNFNSMCHTCIIANYNSTGSFEYKSKGECLRTMTMAELTMEYERVKMMKEIKNELENINNRLNSLGEITTINTEALVELLKQKENNN